jgi:hypothetical protein
VAVITKKLPPMINVIMDCKLPRRTENYLKVGISMKTAARVEKIAQTIKIRRGIERLVSSPRLTKYGINQNIRRKAKKMIEGAATVSDPSNLATRGMLVMGSKKSNTNQTVFVRFR